jgi:hypothetical protein
MKKQTPRLSLHRETVLRLAADPLHQAAGAGISPPHSVNTFGCYTGEPVNTCRPCLTNGTQ